MLPPYYVPSSDSLRHKTAQFVCSFDLHLHGSVGVGIQSEGRLGVPQDARQGLGVHSVGQRVGGKSVPEIMESKAR